MNDLVTEGVHLFEQRRLREASQWLVRVTPAPKDEARRAYWLGRAYLAQDDLVQARAWLSRSVPNPPDPDAWLYLAFAEWRSGEERAAARAMLEFMRRAAEPEAVRGWDPAVAGEIAEVAYAGRERSEDADLGLELIRSLAAKLPDDKTARLRLANALIDTAPIEDAASAVAELRERHGDDPAVKTVQARLMHRRRARLRALEQLERAIDSDPDNLGTRLGAAELYLDLDAGENARDQLDWLRERSGDLDVRSTARLLALELRLNRAEPDSQRLAKLLAEFEFAPPGEKIPPPILAEVDRIRVAVEESFDGRLQEVSGLLKIYGRLRLRDEAEALFRRIAHLKLISTPQVAIRRLEFYCMTVQMDKAESVYDQYFSGRELNRREAQSAIRFLAERKRWEEAGRVLEASLQTRAELPGVGHQLLRVARRSNTRESLLALLDRLVQSGRALDPAVHAFRQMLIDDRCVEEGAGETSEGASPRRLADHNRVLSSLEFGGATTLRGRTALFLCTDSNYFLGVLTFLTSYAIHNRAYAALVDVMVFLADDVPPSWDDQLRDLAAKLNLRLQVLREADFIIGEFNSARFLGLLFRRGRPFTSSLLSPVCRPPPIRAGAVRSSVLHRLRHRLPS